MRRRAILYYQDGKPVYRACALFGCLHLKVKPGDACEAHLTELFGAITRRGNSTPTLMDIMRFGVAKGAEKVRQEEGITVTSAATSAVPMGRKKVACDQDGKPIYTAPRFTGGLNLRADRSTEAELVQLWESLVKQGSAASSVADVLRFGLEKGAEKVREEDGDTTSAAAIP